MPPTPILPPTGFQSKALERHIGATGTTWFRLFRSHFPDPLGYGFASSRFSDPRNFDVHEGRFAVVYFGSSVKVCFAETILRDRGDGRLSSLPIEWAELGGWICGQFRALEDLELVDLRGDSLVRMGIPTDVSRARSHSLGQVWSHAIWSHDLRPDGIVYDSRLNGETNVALYDRALSKLAVDRTPVLTECRSELAAIIRDFDLAII